MRCSSAVRRKSEIALQEAEGFSTDGTDGDVQRRASHRFDGYAPACHRLYTLTTLLKQTGPFLPLAGMRYIINEPHDLKIKEMAVCDRPRERMLSKGVEALTDQELFSILIGSGNRGRSVTAIARDLMELLDRKATVTHSELIQIQAWVPRRRPSSAQPWSWDGGACPKRRRSPPRRTSTLIRHYATRMQEHFLSICLNGAHEVLSINVCSSAGQQNIVHPREVFARRSGTGHRHHRGPNPRAAISSPPGRPGRPRRLRQAGNSWASSSWIISSSARRVLSLLREHVLIVRHDWSSMR